MKKHQVNQMQKNTVLVATLVLNLFILPFSAFAMNEPTSSSTPAQSVVPQKFVGEELEKGAKISMKKARVIALKAAPGEITDEELEVEKGGSGLRYSFDIKKGSTVYEVGVDANTGKVLENIKEGPNPD